MATTIAGADDPAAGLPYEFTTEVSHAVVLAVKDPGTLTWAEHRYLYRAGQRDSHLVVTRADRHPW